MFEKTRHKGNRFKRHKVKNTFNPGSFCLCAFVP